MDNSEQEGVSDTIVVRPTLCWPPIFWMPDYWAESAREYQWVTPATPLADRPYLEFEVSLDVTLGEVLVAACQAWGMVEGPHMKKTGAKLADEFCRFGFVRIPDDEGGIDEQVGYKWPSTIRVVRDDGSVENVPAMSVTFRELLASSSLGLVEGDVTRPYVYPVRPQGVTSVISDFSHISPDDVKAVYAGIDHLARREASRILHRVGAPVEMEVRQIGETSMGPETHTDKAGGIRGWWRDRRR